MQGCYTYTNELLSLEQVGGVTHDSTVTPIQGFLPLNRWDQYLKLHPDQSFANFIRRGIISGFRIGFDRNKVSLKQCANNHQSVDDDRQVVDRYIDLEVANGKLRVSTSKVVHCSPIEIIPKPQQPGKYRLIVDLSAPQGSSVNDGISPDLCSLHYAVALVKSCGPRALMAKIDLR